MIRFTSKYYNIYIYSSPVYILIRIAIEHLDSDERINIVFALLIRLSELKCSKDQGKLSPIWCSFSIAGVRLTFFWLQVK